MIHYKRKIQENGARNEREDKTVTLEVPCKNIIWPPTRCASRQIYERESSEGIHFWCITATPHRIWLSDCWVAALREGKTPTKLSFLFERALYTKFLSESLHDHRELYQNSSQNLHFEVRKIMTMKFWFRLGASNIKSTSVTRLEMTYNLNKGLTHTIFILSVSAHVVIK